MERHGVQHMREIGAKGFDATVARHWNGDRQGYRDYLGLRRHEAQIESFVDREMARRIENGDRRSASSCRFYPGQTTICRFDSVLTAVSGGGSFHRLCFRELPGAVENLLARARA